MIVCCADAEIRLSMSKIVHRVKKKKKQEIMMDYRYLKVDASSGQLEPEERVQARLIYLC